jgi:hypothetical protein
MSAHKITEFHTEWFSVCPNTPQHFATLTYSKSPSKKIMIQMKPVGMSMIIHCTKLHLSKCNSS